MYSLLPLLLLSRFSHVQLCVTPTDGSPSGSPIPGILKERTLEWVAISFSNAWKWKTKVKSLSRARLVATPWTAAYQAPPSMGFSRQEYWSWVPLPSPSRGISQLQISHFQEDPQREILATWRTLQLILWDPVGSECFSWGLWDFL